MCGLCLLMLACGLLGLTHHSMGLSPVILIPGDGGSQLEAKLNKSNVVHYICAKTSTDYFNIWLNLELLVPFVIDCWVDNLRLEYDNVTRTTRSPDGVTVRVPSWGYTEPVEWLDPSHTSSGAYFNSIADALVSIGYVRNVSIRGAPYDFRKAPNENGEYLTRLQALVEETYTANNGSRVTLVAHSMGGCMALQFLRTRPAAWTRRYVRRLVTLSTPWGGAVKALKAFAIGDDLGSRLLSGRTLRAQQVTSPSLAWLLPTRPLWAPDEVLVTTHKYNYTIRDYQKLFLDLELPNAWEMYKDTAQYAGDLTPPPAVEVHCLYGYNLSTVDQLQYAAGAWLDGTPQLMVGDGDGTVNARSLRVCDAWSDGVAGSNSTPLEGADHLRILHDTRALDYITNLLRIDNTTTTTPPAPATPQVTVTPAPARHYKRKYISK